MTFILDVWDGEKQIFLHEISSPGDAEKVIREDISDERLSREALFIYQRKPWRGYRDVGCSVVLKGA